MELTYPPSCKEKANKPDLIFFKNATEFSSTNPIEVSPVISPHKNKNQAPHVPEEEQQFMELRPSEDNSVARSITNQNYENDDNYGEKVS